MGQKKQTRVGSCQKMAGGLLGLSVIDVDEVVVIGDEIVLSSNSPTDVFGVVFEDDGETGYFYALSRNGEDLAILNALHIYNVQNVTDRDRPSRVTIVWSSDGWKSALIINEHPHAVFNFSEKQAYCRTSFPKPALGWQGHEWDDQAMADF
ncbi:MAG TPA: DUF2251 domain-containing protein [Pyrinomonadaceae bacterium]